MGEEQAVKSLPSKGIDCGWGTNSSITLSVWDCWTGSPLSLAVSVTDTMLSFAVCMVNNQFVLTNSAIYS